MAGRRAPGYRVGWAQALRDLGVRYERCRNVEYVVCDCSDWEQHQLWERFAMYLGLPWKQHNMGLTMELYRTTLTGSTGIDADHRDRSLRRCLRPPGRFRALR